MPAQDQKYQQYQLAKNTKLIVSTENEHCHLAIQGKEATIDLISIRSDKKEQFLDAFFRLINVYDVHLVNKLLIS